MEEKFNKTVMPNGLRVISENIPSVRSVTIGIWVEVGSRDESPSINGISHFIEHMVFKRTRNRTAKQIAESLEALGGSLNAFTSREHTCFYARVLDKHLPIAMDVLGDILNNATFTPSDLNKERLVILEEIKDIIDTPSEYIHDIFGQQMWRDHALGQPIIGRAKNIATLKRSTILDYVKNHYCSDRIVVAAAGRVSHQKLVSLTKRHFPWPKAGTGFVETAPQYNGLSVKARRSRTKQTQVCLGFPSIGFNDADRYPLMAVNTYLSGGMSSRLFQVVRERYGYCYTIYSYQEFFRDTGLFCVYFGADDAYVTKAIKLILKELDRLKKRRLTDEEMSNIKEQLKGSLMLSQESTYNRMNRIARQELMLGDHIDLDKTIRNIDRITAEQIRATCNRVFDVGHLTLTTLGPTRQADLEKLNLSHFM